MKIGDKIRFIRDKECNFTQAYMAEQLGITTKAYSNIENNQSDPSYSKLLKIAEALECDINYIINYEHKKIPPIGFYHNSDTGTHLGEIDIEIINKIYESMKRLHAEMLAAAKQVNK